MKTRLEDSVLTSNDILHLYESFLHDTIQQASKSNTSKILLSLTDINKITSSILSGVVFFQQKEIQSIEKLSQNFHIQPEGDFGIRMKSSINWAFDLGYQKLIILGADSPHIQPDTIDLSIKLLEEYDVILGPSAEGGIYLIGIKPNINLEGFESIFRNVELSWFAKYVENQGLNIYILHELIDIDQESDLVGLIAWLESAEIQMRQDNIILKKDNLSFPKKTLNMIRKIGLTIMVDDNNNRRKRLLKLDFVK